VENSWCSKSELSEVWTRCGREEPKVKRSRSHVISDKDPAILDWLEKAREADKGNRMEREEVSPCGSSFTALQELHDTGAITNGYRLWRHGSVKD
jgi:hypothetical protein